MGLVASGPPPLLPITALTTRARDRTLAVALLGQHRFGAGDGRKGFPGALFGRPPSSEPGPKDINETENTNEKKANSNEVNSSEVKPSKTVQVADEAEDPVQMGKVDQPSWGRVGLQCPRWGPSFSGGATSP